MSHACPREDSAVLDYNRLAEEYARHRGVHPEVLRGLVTFGAITRSSRVLEVGCGTGNYIVAVRRTAECSCCGVDPSESMLARARQASNAVEFRAGAAERLEFDSGEFDLVFSVDVIHHLRDREAYFREARRILRGGGKLCTVTDSEAIIRSRKPLAVYFPETVEVELRRYPRLGDLKGMMQRAGFDAVEERTVEFPYGLRDLGAYRDKAFSSLHLISEEAFRRGMGRMEADLREGPIACVSRYVMLWGRTPQSA